MLQARNILAIVLVLAAVGVVAEGHAAATSPAAVEVLEQQCSATGGVGALTVRVTNPTTDTIVVTPHVWSSKQHVQFPWSPSNLQIPPGETVVTIRPPDDRGVIDGGRGQVWVADGQQRAIENFEVRQCE